MSDDEGSSGDEEVQLVDGGSEDDDEQQSTTSSSGSSASFRKAPMIQARLPAYLMEAFEELYHEDGLAVLGRGLGTMLLLATFVRFYADPGPDGHAALVREEQQNERLQQTTTSAASSQAPAVPAATAAGSTPPLVFVLGLKDAERKALVSTLVDWGTPPELLPTEVTNESGQGKDRETMYKRGGIFLITSRILIVDLLTQVANPRDIEGILVAHAENVTEQSTDAFILRIYRTQKQWIASGGAGAGNGNSSSMVSTATVGMPDAVRAVSRTSSLSPSPHGFVKAFTDNCDALMAGFAKVDKILKSLHVRRLYLYPRFHDVVASELEQCPPYVDELHQQLTPAMKEIQNAIAAAVQVCIRELKKSTSLIEWSSSDLTLENCVTTNFDMQISRQLEHDWHKLSPQTKQLVNDLRTLRTLFQYLIHYDCISFYKLINSIKTASAGARNPSMWILDASGEIIFSKARERIFKVAKPKPTKRVPNPVSRLKPILEENPKWRLLSQVVIEIRNDWPERQDHHRRAGRSGTAGGARVLIMVKDERTLDSIRTYLIEGKERIMTLRWVRYLEQINDRSRAVARNAGGSSAISEESRLLLEEEGRARNFLFGAEADRSEHAGAKRKQPTFVPDWKRKQRRIATEKSRGDRTMQAEDIQRRAVLDEALEETEQDLLAGTGYNVKATDQRDVDSSSSGDVYSDEEDELPYKVGNLDELRLVIRTYSSIEGDQTNLMLDDIKPDYVVLYDAEPAFVRSLEMYASTSAAAAAAAPTISDEGPPKEVGDEQSDSAGAGASTTDISKHDRLRVFFMLFEASSEEKNFLKALEREQKAFERLIQHKKTMPMPLNTVNTATQEMQLAMGGAAGSYAGGSLPLSMDTRTGRGKSTANQQRREICVDVREFRSALPSILHQGGMRLAPATLTVGDFVLSKVHCVERKSISDLFGSFASGRLYTQAEAMCKHYKCPILLIEFDPSKSFCLQSGNDIGGDIRSDAVCSKMSILALHFPKLRILWSRSPHETLRIFKLLKENHDEPDIDRAIEIGSNESLDALLGMDQSQEAEDAEDENEINEAARDMLLRLPGITVQNARTIMMHCDTIADLAEMSRDELKRLIGPLSGQKLFTFFRQSTK